MPGHSHMPTSESNAAVVYRPTTYVPRSDPSPSLPFPSSYVCSPRQTHPSSSPSIPPSSSTIYSSTSSASTSMPPSAQFGIYPQPYPINPYHRGLINGYPPSLPSPPWPSEDDITSGLTIDTDMFFDPNTVIEQSNIGIPPRNTSQSPSRNVPTSGCRPGHTPRPPNAWILYRSDRLKAIAAGERLPGLDAVIAEAGLSHSGTEASEDSSAEDKIMTAGSDNVQMAPPPPPMSKKKKTKKGAKEPTQGLLSLGRGKTGRGLPQADISKMISMLWKRETPEIRAKYEHMSEMRKLQVRGETSTIPLCHTSREWNFIEKLINNDTSSIKRSIRATSFNRCAKPTRSRSAKRRRGRKRR